MTRWRWAALAALVTVAAGIGFSIEYTEPCSYFTRNPWADFQDVRTTARAAQLVTVCAAELRRGMLLDAMAFIPAFTAFLLASLWAVRPPRALALATVALLAVGVITDQVEGIRLLALIDAGGHEAAILSAANKASFAKILFLALATAGVAIAVLRDRRWRSIGGGLAALAALAAVAMTLANRQGSATLGLAWLALAVVALVQSLRRSTHV